jgi:hypothetical protein
LLGGGAKRTHSYWCSRDLSDLEVEYMERKKERGWSG